MRLRPLGQYAIWLFVTRPFLRRFGGAGLDQAVSSVSNLLLSVLVARNSSAEEFGIFGICFAVYLVSLGVVRAVIGEPLLLRLGDVGGTRGAVARDAASAAFFVVVVVALLGLMAGLGINQDARPYVWALSASLVGVLLVDFARYVCFAAGLISRAVRIDLAWLAAQVLAFIALVMLGTPGWWFLAAWGLASYPIAFVVVGRMIGLPSIQRSRAWFRQTGDLWPNYLGEFALLSGMQQAVTFVTAAVSGVAAAGSLRAAQTITGPVNVVTGSANMVLLPAGRRRFRQHGRGSLIRYMIASASALSGICLVWALGISLVPPYVGHALLGSSWEGGRGVAVVFGVVLAINAASYGATAGLRIVERSRVSLLVRLALAPVTMGLVTAGCIKAGALGAVLGLALGGMLMSAAWWFAFVKVSSSAT